MGFGVSPSRLRKVHPRSSSVGGNGPTRQCVHARGFSLPVSVLVFLLLSAPVAQVFPSPGGIAGRKVSIPTCAAGASQMPMVSLSPCLCRSRCQREASPWSSGARISAPKPTGPLPQEEWAFRVKNGLVRISQPPRLSLWYLHHPWSPLSPFGVCWDFSSAVISLPFCK